MSHNSYCFSNQNDCLLLVLHYWSTFICSRTFLFVDLEDETLVWREPHDIVVSRQRSHSAWVAKWNNCETVTRHTSVYCFGLIASGKQHSIDCGQQRSQTSPEFGREQRTQVRCRCTPEQCWIMQKDNAEESNFLILILATSNWPLANSVIINIALE